MFCPSCQNTQRERQRGDVMLDICPGCHGVWLDRGELEKLTTSERGYYRHRGDDDDDDGDWERGQRYEARGEHDSPRRKKRGGFLENIFGNFGEGGADD